jgi:catechol 2,3-dioxygenase-like lactoylglutathione lyase family enzyme
MIHVRALDHIVLNVADVDRALRFYADGLGLVPERLEEYRRGECPFPSVRVSADTIVDLFPPAMRKDAPASGERANLDHFCLVVEEQLDTVQEHLAALGVAIENGPVRVFGARGTGTSVYVLDPDGTLVELRSYG